MSHDPSPGRNQPPASDAQPKPGGIRPSASAEQGDVRDPDHSWGTRPFDPSTESLAEQGDVEAIRTVLRAGLREVAHGRKVPGEDALDRLAASLERAELDRDEAQGLLDDIDDDDDYERERRLKAERALAEYEKALENVRLNEFNGGGDFSPLMRARAALRPSEESSDES